MNTSRPILASEATAAKLLDMKLSEFRGLVEAGHLPCGREIAPGLLRWDTDALVRIAAGETALGAEMEW